MQAAGAAGGPDCPEKFSGAAGPLFALCGKMENVPRARRRLHREEKRRRASRKHGLCQQKHQRQAGGE